MSQCVWQKAAVSRLKTALCPLTEGTHIVCRSKKDPQGTDCDFLSGFSGRTDANFDAEYNLLSVCPLLSPSPLWQCSCYMRISSHTLHALMNWCEQGCLLHRLSFIHTSRVCPTSLHNYQLNLLLSREDLQASTILTSCRNLYLPVTRVLVCVCVSVRVKWNTKFLWLIWLALSGFFYCQRLQYFEIGSVQTTCWQKSVWACIHAW